MEKWANRQTLAREAEDKKTHTDKFKRQLGLADELRQNYDKQTREEKQTGKLGRRKGTKKNRSQTEQRGECRRGGKEEKIKRRTNKVKTRRGRRDGKTKRGETRRD